ncbi:MAG TPA: LiaF domain-containing protein [Gemmatimonadaceae bacterium]
MSRTGVPQSDLVRQAPRILPPSAVPDRAGVAACFSKSVREGDWLLPRGFRAVALMGSVKLDLTRSAVAEGVSDIEIVCVMGSVEIIVPHQLRVECDGDQTVGSFEITHDSGSAPAADAPLLRIRGRAFMGSVDVKVVDPNAPGWLERLRSGWDFFRR